MRPLNVSPCQRQCSWHRVGDAGTEPDLPDLFACSSCGGEWTPDQAWTPADADGTVPYEVARLRRGAG